MSCPRNFPTHTRKSLSHQQPNSSSAFFAEALHEVLRCFPPSCTHPRDAGSVWSDSRTTLQSAEVECALFPLKLAARHKEQMLKVKDKQHFYVFHKVDSLAGLAGVCRSQKLSTYVTCTLLNMSKPLRRCKKMHNWSHFVNDECVHALTPEPEQQH